MRRRVRTVHIEGDATGAVIVQGDHSQVFVFQNAEQVFSLMLELNRERGTSLVVVTHDTRLAARMERMLEIDDGILTESQ